MRSAETDGDKKDKTLKASDCKALRPPRGLIRSLKVRRNLPTAWSRVQKRKIEGLIFSPDPGRKIA